MRYLVAQGLTVSCVSWKNPRAVAKNLDLDDHLRGGVLATLDTIGAIVPDRKVHAMGYCLGGTPLSITAAKTTGDHDHRLASLTLLAAQANFSEPGELALYIDDSAVGMLAAQMEHTGYLTGAQMADAFVLLHSQSALRRAADALRRHAAHPDLSRRRRSSRQLRRHGAGVGSARIHGARSGC